MEGLRILKTEAKEDKYEELMELAKRRGFFWQSFEIYGGVSGFYDLGPLGTLMKRNIIDLWLKYFVLRHMDLATIIETPVINPAKVFEASGHLESFTDPIVRCEKCGGIFRADKLIEEKLKIRAEGKKPEELTQIIKENDLRCPSCGGPLGEVRTFNLLFKTTIGPYEGNTGYLRPETAQGMFISFKRVHTVMRNRLPLGIAQIGRVARNEISPRQGMIRLREFTIAEMEFFFDPEKPGQPPFERISGGIKSKLNILRAEDRLEGVEKPSQYTIEEAIEEGIVVSPWMAYWMAVSRDFVKGLGLSEEETFFEEKLPEERAHYATQTFDQLVKVSRWGWVEVSGHAYRGDYDLSRHQKYSGQDLTVFRRYEKPIKKKLKKVRINKAIIGRELGSDAVKVIGALRAMSPEEVEKLLETPEEFIEVEGRRIPKDAVKVVVQEEVVHGEKVIPHVVEPSFGVERLVFVALDKAYTKEGDRVVLRLSPRIAPIKVAVFPLVTNDEEIVRIAREIYEKFLEAGIAALYDTSGAIGRRYYRADEIGVPYAITVDHRSKEDRTVTIRYRDTREQIRISISDVISWVTEKVR